MNDGDKDRYSQFAREVVNKYYHQPYGIPSLHAALHIEFELRKNPPTSKKVAIKYVKSFRQKPLDNHPFHVSAMERVVDEIIEAIKAADE